jgi:flavin-dependent dehydrogenase
VGAQSGELEVSARSSSPSTDVLVVGGGPAGSAAAIAARRLGARVILLERDRAPRDRPGETLHPGIEPLLERLGAADVLRSATLARHDGHWDATGGRRRFEPFGRDARGVWRGFQAERKVLDAGLRARAAESGVVLLQGVGAAALRQSHAGRVSGVVTSAGEAIAATIVVDAAGGRHWLARQLGIGVRQLSPRYVATWGYVTSPGRSPSAVARAAATAGMRLPRNPLFRRDADGWIWIAPLGGDRWHWTRLSFRGRRMAADWRPSELRGLVPSGPARGADLTWRVAQALAGPGWVLAGDAAAVLDPASSHGVLRAICTGVRAGDLAARAGGAGPGVEECCGAYADWVRAGVEADAAALRAIYATRAPALDEEVFSDRSPAGVV